MRPERTRFGGSIGSRSPASRAAIEADIRRYSSACGCELGALLAAFGAISFSVYATLATTGWSTVETFWRGGIWVLSLSVLGKLLGLGYARVRLQMLRAEQRRAFSSGESLHSPLNESR
jgi:hypothetical protein